MGCGKRRHPNATAAIAAAIRCSKRGRPLRVYRCPDCGGWHLTSRVRIATPDTERNAS